MNNTLKIVLGFLLGALFTCLLVAVLAFTLFQSATRSVLSSVQADPGEAAQVGQAIADYDVPAGYSPSVATQFAHFEVVGYDGPTGSTHLYLFQLPPSVHVDQPELERQLQSATETEGSGDVTNMQIVDEQPVTIRGQATTLVVSEGVNGQGEPIRSANAAFQGKDGQALVSFSGPIAAWDTEVVEAFLASLR